MRTALLLAVLLLPACDDFYAVQQADSIEAYEEYIEKNPDSRMRLQATTRLEELYLEKAREDGTLAAYDVYLERFPEGVYRDKAMGEREDFMWAWALREGTVESLEAYLAEYPRASKKRKGKARRLMAVAEYAPHLAIAPISTERVNMAEDPEGPLNGWAIHTEVTNNGEREIVQLVLAVRYTVPGAPIATEKEWPVVAETWTVPLEEEQKLPMKPGDMRPWTWTTADLPEAWSGEADIHPVQISFEGD